MSDLISKLTSYNLFNYLLPGTVFAVLAGEVTSFSLRQDDLFVAFFVYYFLGLILSRVGSVMIEPVLKKVGFVQFAPYGDFVRRSQVDSKLEVLSEANNSYRTFVALFLSLALMRLGQWFIDATDAPGTVVSGGLWVFLTVLFLFSYRKQTQYIRERVSSTETNG